MAAVAGQLAADPAAMAADALRLADADPARASALASEALRRARAGGDPATASVAERALGLAAREHHDLKAAVAHLRRAIRIAEQRDLTRHAAQARVSLSGTLALRGDLPGALREADRAAPGLTGPDLALLQGQRAFVLHMQGRFEEALEGYQRILGSFRRAGDTHREATTLNNRGVLYFHLGALDAAEADLVRAEELFTALGQERAAVDISENLGSILVRKGRLSAALAWFDRADEYARAHGMVDGVALQHRCDALLAARLVTEARQTAERAVRALARTSMRAFLAEARLVLAEAALLEGDLATARAAARQARRAFQRQRRPSFLALARYTSLQVEWMSGNRSPAQLRAARQTAAALASAGWAIQALHARLIAARLAIDLRHLAVARAELALASRARHRGPVELRSRAWHALALLRLADGNRRGAESALRAGMRVLDRYRAALGASELRANASGHGADLAQLGLRLALQDGDARRVLTWAERWRAGALRVLPAQPPADEALAADLAELRRVVSELGEAALAGRDTARFLKRQASLEEAVRRRARRAPGADRGGASHELDLDACRAALGERALVELVELDGDLHAVVVTGRRLRLRRLGRLEEVVVELENLPFALRQLAFAHGSAASRAVARSAAELAARRLDDLLIGPLHGDVGERPLVIVPTGPLHALPWSVLPSCAGRPVAVAPSAELWHKAASAEAASAEAAGGRTAGGRTAGAGRVVLIAGPGLADAAAEVATLRDRYPGARCFQGAEARVEAVARALEGADLVHLAAHGRFRADNPFFSSLRLADGPLTVYDLEALSRAPSRLVLSACDSGLSAVRPGDELMGLASALFALGTTTLIASVVPISDAATRPLMLRLHELLGAGLAPATALARAQAQGTAGDGAFAASVSFVCFGAG
jgi:tetratricopeptide (TPR) repeat protein